MLPETIDAGPACIIAITSERTEPLTRRPTDDDVRRRVAGTVFDVPREDLTAEVPLERGSRGVVVLDREDRRIPHVGEMEAEAEPAGAGEQIDARDRPAWLPVRCTALHEGGPGFIECPHLPGRPWSEHELTPYPVTSASRAKPPRTIGVEQDNGASKAPSELHATQWSPGAGGPPTTMPWEGRR